MGRRRVKYLYVDDDSGVLVADCEGGPAVVGAVLNHGRLPANQAPPIEEVNPVPSAGPEWLGRTVRYREDGKTELLCCLQNSAGGYEWVEVGEST